MDYRPFYGLGAGLATLLLFAGCNSRTDVSLTGNASAQYSHVWVTTKEIWFNTGSSAGPDDAGWNKFVLSSPVTVDLVTNAGGTLGTLATSLKLLPGSYAQMRIIALDPSEPLATSARTLGALYNAEADYTDATNTLHQMRLELLNPDKGIGVAASLHVPVGNLGAALVATTSTGTGTTNSTGTGTTGTTGTTSTSSASTTTSTTTKTSFAVSLDGARDLVPFTYGGAATPAILLNPHPSGYDRASVGGIQGQLTLTNLPLSSISSTSGIIDLQVSAETLSADGSRHIIVLSAPVRNDGSFLVYPLPSSASSPASYDLVIHGPGMASIIIRNVTLTLPSTSTTSSTAVSTGTGSTTTTSVEATTASSNGINTVSVGTLTPRSATSYRANITPAAGSVLPAGSVVSFFQTPGGSTDVPYVIEANPIDPFNHSLANGQVLSAGTVDSGTYAASGASITLVSATPAEGTGRYLLAASAPDYADAALSASVTAPQPVSPSVPTPTLASGGLSGSVLASITVTTPGKYNQGELLISHEGSLVARAALNTALAQGGDVTVSVPANLPAARYYASVRVWNSNAPTTTLQRQWYATALDLRSTTSATVALTIN